MFILNKKSRKKENGVSNERLEIEKKEEQYKQRSFKRESTGPIAPILVSIALIICFIAILSICNISINAYRVNVWWGHIVTSALVAIFFIIIVYPVIKVFKQLHFILEYDDNNYKKVKKHNDKVVKSIAKNIIDFNDNIYNSDYYNPLYVDELRHSLNKKDMLAIRKNLRNIMNKTVKTKSNEIIVKWAKRVGIMSAVSQSEKIDGIVIIICNIKLIYDLIFLYGFRYSLVRLAKSSFTILFSVATASSLQGVKIGKGTMNVLGSFIKTLPIFSMPVAAVNPAAIGALPITAFISSALSAVVDSGVQGLGNAFMTVAIGYQTISYLNKEYRLQDELNDEFDKLDLLDDENELKETLKQVKAEVEKADKDISKK